MPNITTSNYHVFLCFHWNHGIFLWILFLWRKTTYFSVACSKCVDSRLVASKSNLKMTCSRIRFEIIWDLLNNREFENRNYSKLFKMVHFIKYALRDKTKTIRIIVFFSIFNEISNFSSYQSMRFELKCNFNESKYYNSIEFMRKSLCIEYNTIYECQL